MRLYLSYHEDGRAKVVAADGLKYNAEVKDSNVLLLQFDEGYNSLFETLFKTASGPVSLYVVENQANGVTAIQCFVSTLTGFSGCQGVYLEVEDYTGFVDWLEAVS